MKGQTYIISALIFAVVIAVFAVINVENVEVNYLFGTGEAPLILVILVSVLLGGLATASVGAVRYFRLRRENRSLQEKLQAYEKESGEKMEPVSGTSEEADSRENIT
ncbi:DUF1049 domain-containing protein [Halobacillus halophilus]|uniref:LapA family protein n=1 Tax=Halobacillus halophilus TaxID=1570 RepID=UPI00136EE308|nr:lipopolysaccharide assembly protein LapA domain-containing protein [Halobacillus halophilus]MYL29032.1 DUF1049 domain-containing protein [Halobacillus halophilus]